MKITGETKIVGIFAYPVRHSLSPLMHNSAFSYLGLNYIYLPFQIRESELKNAVLSIKALNITGVNITVPHKEKVLKELDELSDEVLKIGAVNTILNKDGKLIGFNTDKFGFIKSLLLAGVKLENKRIMVLGCGGASRAVCFGVLEHNIRTLIITDVIEEKLKKLKKDLKKFHKDKYIQGIVYNEEKIFEKLSDIDILVNATPVGMTPDVNSSPILGIPKSNKNLIVYDLVYNPLKTKLLKLAEKQNLKTVSGIEMLIWQGAKAFEMWTGRKAPTDVMRKEVKKYL